MLIDTHAHLYWDLYKEDLAEVLQRAKAADVTTIVNVGVNVKLSEEAAKFKYPNFQFYSTLGIHPHEAVKYFSNPSVSIHQDIAKLDQLYQTLPDQIVAVGECGLDYFFLDEYLVTPDGTTLSPAQAQALQAQLFQAQIDLAKKLKLPLVVHCRDDRSKEPANSEAWNKVLEMVGSHPAILHCYSGMPPTTNHVLQAANLLVSFAATITYPKNDYLREAAKLLPLEKIILETDCPFLPPQSKRGQRNEPATVLEIAQLIAELKEMPLTEVARQTSQNAKRILNI